MGSGIILTPATLDAAFLRFDTIFQQVFGDQKPRWQAIATELQSTTEEERHAWLKAVSELREWIGERRIDNLSANLQLIKNKTYEKTLGVPRTKIEDDQLGIFDPLVRELARVTANWPDRIVADAILAGESATCHDGQPFFSASHPINPDDAGLGTQANLFTGGTARALTYDNVQKTRTSLRLMKREDGIPIDLAPSKWTLIVPASLEMAALQIANQEWVAPTTDFAIGKAGVVQQNLLRGNIDVVILPRLDATDTTSWYLADCSRAVKPFIFQNRVAAEFTYLNRPDDENVFKLDQMLMGVRTRGAAGYGPYYTIAKCKAS
jgi:phage major head subunit gpT-like protein